MKTLFSIGMAALLLGTVLSADLVAAGKIEQRLMKQGWVKLTVQELMALKDFTASDDFGWAEYIGPSGATVVTQYQNGTTKKGTREITADGQYCYLYRGEPTTVCRSLWKRGKYYAHVRSRGLGAAKRNIVRVQITIKPGNTQNL